MVAHNTISSIHQTWDERFESPIAQIKLTNMIKENVRSVMFHSRYKLKKRMISNKRQNAIPASLKMRASSHRKYHMQNEKNHNIPNKLPNIFLSM